MFKSKLQASHHAISEAWGRASCANGSSKPTPGREFMFLCSFLCIRNEHRRKERWRMRVHVSEGRLRRIIFLSCSSLALLQCGFMWPCLSFQHRCVRPILWVESWTMTQGNISFQGCINELSAQWSVQYHVSQHFSWRLDLQTQLWSKAGCKSTAEFRASLSTAEFVPLLLGYVQQGGSDDDWDSWTLMPALPPTHCHLLR